MAKSNKIEVTDPDSKITYLIDFSDADISISGNIKVKPKEQPKPEEPKPEEPVNYCKQGPEPKKITNPTQTSLMLGWHGEDVFGWDWKIMKGDISVAGGAISPKGNQERVSYPQLDPGDYRFVMQGNTCQSQPKGLDFTIPKTDSGGGTQPPPVVNRKGKFQIVMGTTGGGFDSKAKYGIKEGEWENGKYHEGWLDRIEATKFSWGYGISGICIWIGWEEYEPKPGQYEEAAFQRVIDFCKDRGLTLSVAFMPRRHRGDGFINEDEIITGSGGTQYWEGVYETGMVYAGYANDRVNKLMQGAVKSIAKLLKKYNNAYYMARTGGGAGEHVNYVFRNSKGIWETADFSDDSLRRFDAWRIPRGIDKSPSGRPPMIQGPGIDWPHPDWNNPKGEEFGRFTTYGIKKSLDSFVEAVKSVSDIKCLYFYSATSNRQMRATANPLLGWIAEKADGFYGSDGDGPGDLYAKIKVNSLNLGLYPDKISSTELDPDDMSPSRNNTGKMPDYGQGGLLYNNFLQIARDLYSRGLECLHLAMAFSVQELKDFEPTLKTLNEEWLNRDYFRPQITAANTVEVDVTDKYRSDRDLMDGVKAYDVYTKYVGPTFWGGVPPELGDGGTTAPPPSNADYSPVKSYLEGNIANYNWNVIFDLRDPGKELYSFTKGQYDKSSRLKVMSHSKFTTGVIIAYLIDQGKLSLDTKVGDVIRSWDHPDRAGITVRQIMGHLSGIPDNTDNEGADTLEYYVDNLVNKPGFSTPGEQFIYSTSSYQVVARMAELVSGKTWRGLFKEILVDPCEMGNAEYNPTIGDIKGKPLNPLAGYGLVCSESEWMNFISMIRDGGTYKGRRVLSQNVLDILKTKTSPGWSDWGVGVMFTDDQFISEAASGCFTFILPSKYAGTIFTQSNYESTYGSNHYVRRMVYDIYSQGAMS